VLTRFADCDAATAQKLDDGISAIEPSATMHAAATTKARF